MNGHCFLDLELKGGHSCNAFGGGTHPVLAALLLGGLFVRRWRRCSVKPQLQKDRYLP